MKLASLCRDQEGDTRMRLSQVFDENSIWGEANFSINIPLEMGKTGYVYVGLSEDTFQRNGIYNFSLKDLGKDATPGTYVLRVEMDEYGGISFYKRIYLGDGTQNQEMLLQGGNGREATPGSFECELTLEAGVDYFIIFSVDPSRAKKDKVPLTFTITKKEEKPQTITLGKPSAPQVEVGASGVKLCWNAVPSAKKYQVYRIENGKTTKLGKTTALTFTDKTAKNGGSYTYKIGTVKYTSGSTTYAAGKKSAGTELVFLTAPTKLTLSSTKAKKATASWKKNASATGYELRYSTDSSMKEAKTLSITKNTTVKKTVKSLKSKAVYYFQIRSYKKVGTKKYVSAWSSAVKVKIK